MFLVGTGVNRAELASVPPPVGHPGGHSEFQMKVRPSEPRGRSVGRPGALEIHLGNVQVRLSSSQEGGSGLSCVPRFLCWGPDPHADGREVIKVTGVTAWAPPHGVSIFLRRETPGWARRGGHRLRARSIASGGPAALLASASAPRPRRWAQWGGGSVSPRCAVLRQPRGRSRV